MAKPIFLSEKEFKKSFELAPRVAINIFLKNKEGEILLANRSYGDFLGEWYYPGGFLYKDETFKGCFERISNRELGETLKFKNARFKGIFENLNKDSRGHILDMIYEIKLNEREIKKLNTLEKTTFFKTLPKNIYAGHKPVLNALGYK